MDRLDYFKLGGRMALDHWLGRVSQHLGMCLCKPRSVHIDVTGRCNLKCVHCDVWKKPAGTELDTEEWKKAISSLRNWLGPFFLTFSGGEPFMRNDLLELVSFASKNNAVTRVITNGVLVDEKKAGEVDKSGLDLITVSIDGLNPETHDKIRGAGGLHAKAMKAVELFQKSDKKIRVNIATMVLKQNLDEAVDLAEWADKETNGILYQALWHNPNKNSENLWQRKEELWPDYNELSKVMNRLIELKKSGIRIINPVGQLELMKEYYRKGGINARGRCAAGYNSFNIKEQGDVYLCPSMKPIGNITSARPEEIWNSLDAARRRKEIKKCCMNCSPMNYGKTGIIENFRKFRTIFAT